MPTRTIWLLLSKNGGLIFKAHFMIAADATRYGSLGPSSKQFGTTLLKTEKDPLIHRKVVNVVNGLADGLKATRKQVPGEVLAEADRLECCSFAGYDPYFEGNESPGL